MTDPADINLPDPLAEARDSITALAGALDEAELNYATLPDTTVSTNLLLSFGDDGYVLITVLQGNESTCYLTTGAVADLLDDRLAALEFANTRTRENPALPVFVHDGGGTLDLLVQQSHPVGVLATNPAFLQAMVHANIGRTGAVRQAAVSAELGGRPYAADGDDLERLAQRAVS